MKENGIFGGIVKAILRARFQPDYDHPGSRETRLAASVARVHHQPPKVGWLAFLVARAISSLSEGERLDGGTGEVASGINPNEFRDMY